ncbi:MAG TPA: AraC family transcriptional regulator [Polyangiaceae bacterium]|nr:AraC family transcriptional regulator [Polyangiaceae bacterium]
MCAALFQPFPMLPGRAAQVWRHQPAYQRPRHFHEEPELNAVLAGSARLGIGDRTLELGPGELVVFEPGQDHVLLEASPDLELVVAALRPALAERARGESPSIHARKLLLAPRELTAVRERSLALGDVHDKTAVERAVVELFVLLTTRGATTHASTRRAVGLVRAAPVVSASEVARRLRRAPAALSRAFHRDLGLTLVEYRARVRLMRFIALVDDGAALGTAALDADFGSYAQCHRTFQRALGCSPRDYFGGVRCSIDALTSAAEYDTGVHSDRS